MTVFNLNGDSPGAWFDLEGGGRVQIRQMTVDALKAIRKQTIKTRTEYKRVDGKVERFTVEDVNEDLQSELFWDHVILGWEKFFDGKGNEIPCTTENKILLMLRSVVFASAVSKALDSLKDDEARQAETALENLSRG